MMKLSNGFKAILAVAATASLAMPALAQFAQGNIVTFNGRPLFSVQGANGFDPAHRAWITQDRLDNALVLAADRSPGAVAVEVRNGAHVVTLDRRIVATADANSAAAAGLSPKQLAHRWAKSLRGALANGPDTLAYVAKLTSEHAVGQTVAVLERQVYTAAGTVLPICLTCPISSETAVHGQRVQATLASDYAIGNYVVPRGSTVQGQILEQAPGQLVVAFNQLCTPAGTAVPISGYLTEHLSTAGLSARTVCTLSLPAGLESPCRMPANIGIGTLPPGGKKLVLRRGSNVCIAAGQPLGVLFDAPATIAVSVRDTAL